MVATHGGGFVATMAGSTAIPATWHLHPSRHGQPPSMSRDDEGRAWDTWMSPPHIKKSCVGHAALAFGQDGCTSSTYMTTKTSHYLLISVFLILAARTLRGTCFLTSSSRVC